MVKRFHLPFELIIVTIVVAVNLFVVFAPANSLMNWYTTDDAFYYFKTAQNIGEGRGITFDGIARASGFHPLWMAVCVPVFLLARIDLILPLRVLALISILLASGTGVLLYRIFKRALAPEVASLMALFWVLNSDIHYVTTQLGMESSINAFFSTFLIYKLVTFEDSNPDGSEVDWKRILPVGIIAVLALLSRLDNVFLVLLVGVWLVLRRSGARYLLLTDWLLAAASVFCSFFLRLGYRFDYEQYIPSAVWMLGIGLVVQTVIFYLGGLYGAPAGESRLRQLLRIVGSVAVSALITAVLALALQYFKVYTGFPRTALIISFAINLVGALAVRGLYALIVPGKSLLPPAGPENRVPASWNRWLREAFPYFGALGLALLTYMAWNYLYFGTSMPVSGQIKHWWGSIYTVYGRPISSLVQFFGFSEELRGGAWGLMYSFHNNTAAWISTVFKIMDEGLTGSIAFGFALLYGALAVAAAAAGWRRALDSLARLGFFPLLMANFAQIFYYNGTNYVNMRAWYWVTQMLAIAMLFAVLVENACHALRRLKVSPLVLRGAGTVISLLMVIDMVSVLLQLVPMQVKPGREKNYLGGIVALEEATEPGTLIGSTGGGVIAYFIQDRTIVNLDGLMNSYSYYRAMRDGTAHEYLNEIGLSYVYGNEYMLTESEPFARIFKDRTRKMGLVGGSTLFRYQLPLPAKKKSG